VVETLRSLTEEAVKHGSEAGTPAELADNVSKAGAFLARGKIKETLRECGSVLRRDPDNALARLYAGIAVFKRGDLERAERLLRQYLALQPQDSSLHSRVRAILEYVEERQSRRKTDHPGGDARGSATALRAATPARIVRVQQSGQAPGTVLNVNWVITEHCNFTCSYCTVYDNTTPYASLEQMKSAADKIARLGRPDIRVVLTGGEPTIHPGYIPFIRHLAERVPNLSTLQTESNLSRTPRFYRDLVDAMGEHLSIMCFHCSFHFEFTDIDQLLANARFLSQHGIDVQIRLLAHPEHMPAVKRLARELSAQRNDHLTYIVKTIRKNFGVHPDDRYEPEDLAWIAEVYDTDDIERSVAVEFLGPGANPERERRHFSPNELIARRLNRFKGMYCNAGVEMLSIGPTGRLDRAVCFRGMKGRQPNIYRDPEIPEEFQKPVICPFEACGCPEDIALSKVAVARRSPRTKTVDGRVAPPRS
jgi:organic radical activating enzyme